MIVSTNASRGAASMGTANRERQKRWREKQDAAGRKRFTVVVDRDVYDLLKAQKVRTGQTLSGVISRAVRLMAAEPDPLATVKQGTTADKPVRGPAPSPGGNDRGIEEARSMIRRLLTLGRS